MTDVLSLERLFSIPEVEKYTLCGMADVETLRMFLDEPYVSTEFYPEGLVTYVQKDGYQEVHVAFEPEAWGRKVASILARSFGAKMKECVCLIAREQEHYWRSRPPKSHGWKVCGDFEKTEHPARLRKWILTPDAWYGSPVGRKSK